MESKWERLQEMREKLDETKIKFIQSMKHISANFDEIYSLCNSMEEELHSCLSGEKENIKDSDLECKKKILEEREFSLEKREKRIKRKEKVLEKRKHGYKKTCTFKERLKEMVKGFLSRYMGNVIKDKDEHKQIAKKVVREIIEKEIAKGFQIPQSEVEVANFLFPKTAEIRRAVEDEVEKIKMEERKREGVLMGW